ncbi:farnesyl diphosphate synthase [Alteromonas sp. ASW11-130]|uniref:farnesyl diphosphate synthase n=1 Tax=Alteromonas sp. ASW11-130 TaxID=3015775 RepID=UPI002241B139|nr:farnesyl diphosphate synthase [Alteromonas sp. ASW11-130]MCW8093015.1 polyprenyl synthetase family protein [Alteromonas sp. ASW11-130]
MNFSELHSQVRYKTDQGLSNIIDILPDHSSTLKSAMRYALLSGGKRTRPLLVYLIGETVSVEDTDLLTISMAIECIHAYSLVHDDLPAMDDDDLRRGKPTCHKAFDEATAILAGDALQSLAFTLLADHPMSTNGGARRAALVSILAKAAGYLGMCGGQAIDLQTTGQSITLTELTQLHQLKTGALLCACAEMVTVLAPNLTPQQTGALIDYARLIGLIFQIQDDILDIEGHSDITGKPQGSDLELGKNTFPALLGLHSAKEELAKLHKQALQALTGLPYNTEALTAFTDFVVKRDH